MSLKMPRFTRFITVLIGLLLLVFGSVSAQDETPVPPPTVEEVAPTLEPTFTSVPTNEPTATEVPPTQEPTAEPTLEPTLEPTVEPTLEPTVEPTLAPTSEATSEFVTETPQDAATVEQTVETTPEYITATPEGLITPTLTEVPIRSGERGIGVHVDNNLLELQGLLNEGNVAQAQTEATMMQLDVSSNGQLVHIEVLAANAAEAARLRPIIEGLGGVFLIGFDRRLEFDFPILRLMDLEATPGSFAVLQPQEGRPTLGPTTSEGVQVTGAAQWHARGINGLGVKVGVVDIGFNGYASAETTNCVKAASNFIPGTTFTTYGDHGTNVAQIICDMAPKAEVYLAQATTLSSLNAAVDWLISQNVNVINMSMRWDSLGAGDGTGEVNTIVQRAINAGILWVNAAGNSNGDTWSGAYANMSWDPDGPSTFFSTGDYLDFGGGNAVLDLFGGRTESSLFCGTAANLPYHSLPLHAIARWNDWNATRTGNATMQDYDLFIVRSTDGGITWNAIIDSQGTQNPNLTISPVEEGNGGITCVAPNARYGVIIRRFSATPDEYIQLISWSSGPLGTPNPYSTSSSSISTPADSAAVLSVAAGEVKAAGFPFHGYPDLAQYSSRGPILGPGGSAPGACSPNCKPDITAPTNVLTSRSSAFNGTSAASPHATGFAALVFQWNRSYYETFTGASRAAAIKTDILNLFTRDPVTSFYSHCNGGTAHDCFGTGVMTIYPDWFSWTDVRLEHTSGTIVRSGAGWTQQTQSGSSGGNYAYTTGYFAQIEFGVAYATGVNICLYQRPDLVGVTAEVYRDGILQPVVGDPFVLGNPTPTQVCRSFDTSDYDDYNSFVIRPTGGRGLTLDYIQVVDTIQTLQENQLNTFGTWTRTALASTSGGYYSYNSQRGAGVQFYTTDDQFTITYTKRPTGGIMEIWVNGQQIPDGLLFCPEISFPIHEINTYSGSTTLTSAQHICRVSGLFPVFGPGPYVVQLVNSGRQTPGTVARPIISIDNIRFPAGGGAIPAGAALEAELGYTGQVGSTMLPMNGVWNNMAAASASGGRHFTTTTTNAEFRFRTNANRVAVYFTGTTTGALLEIYVNGQLCTDCGTIDTYRPATMYKVPYTFTIPGTFTSPYHITLRNSGRANPSVTASTRTMTIDRVDVLGGGFEPLSLYNVQGDVGSGFSINERWIMNAQPQAITGDVYLNNSQYGNLFFTTDSRDFTLLLGKNPNGGILRLQIWNGSSYDLLGEFNGQATSTLWRYGLNATVPMSYTPPFTMLVEVDAQTQFGGGTLDYGYIDALLINDGGSPVGGSFTTLAEMYQNGGAHGDVNVVQVGPGWENVPANSLAEFAQGQGESARRSRGSGASFQFTLPAATTYPRLLYNRMPDGGIGEVWINGVFQYEVDFYSPVARAQQILPLTIPGGIQYPAVVEVRYTGRRTTGSTNTYIYLDAILATSPGSTGFNAPIITTGIQNDSTNLQLFGAAWTTSAASTSVFPSGSSIATTTTNSGGVRFRLSGSRRFAFVSSTSANRGVAEIWVNGRLCTGCGTINTYRPATYWQVPFVVEIPATFTPGPPYFVEIRTTNVRSTTATGFGLSTDEIIALDGGTIDWNASLATSVGLTEPGSWSVVSSTNALDGTFFRTTLASTVSNGVDTGNDGIADDDLNSDGYKDLQTQSFTYSAASTQDEIILLRNTTTNGGIAEIWITDWDPVDNVDVFRLCFECGTINNYSTYTRYQMPYYFQIPARFVGNPNFSGRHIVRFLNTATRAAGSTGNYLEIDGFMFP